MRQAPRVLHEAAAYTCSRGCLRQTQRKGASCSRGARTLFLPSVAAVRGKESTRHRQADADAAHRPGGPTPRHVRALAVLVPRLSAGEDVDARTHVWSLARVLPPAAARPLRGDTAPDVAITLEEPTPSPLPTCPGARRHPRLALATDIDARFARALWPTRSLLHGPRDVLARGSAMTDAARSAAPWLRRHLLCSPPSHPAPAARASLHRHSSGGDLISRSVRAHQQYAAPPQSRDPAAPSSGGVGPPPPPSVPPPPPSSIRTRCRAPVLLPYGAYAARHSRVSPTLGAMPASGPSSRAWGGAASVRSAATVHRHVFLAWA